MAKVILFGGGDGGGIRITATGVEPIPPFEPALRRQLRALNALIHAERLTPERANAQTIGGVVERLSHTVLSQLETLVGEIDAEDGLVYQDVDGGFVCGSTGKPPIPFPWPVDPRRTVEDLVTRSILDAPTIAFLEQAALQKLDVLTVARDPRAAAERLGVTLPADVETSLQSLHREADRVEDQTDREVVEFYQKVVTDGRYIAESVVNPEAVARRLDTQMSPEAVSRVLASRDFALTQPGGAVMNPGAYAVAVTIAVVIVVWSREAELPVIDRSGIWKL